MIKKKKKDVSNIKVDPVKIKPLFGLEPGLWLTLAYLIGLLLFLFLFGILPDIINKGSKRLTFSSSVYNCAVYVDGKYVGGTPFTAKISSGEHEIVYKKNDIIVDSFKVEVSHPVFFAYLFPRYQNIHSSVKLNNQIYLAVLKEFFQNLINYSAIQNYDSVYHYPPLYTDFVKTVSDFDDFNIEVLNLSASFITSQEMLSDAKNAFSLINYNYDFSNLEKEIPIKYFNRFNVSDSTSVLGNKDILLDEVFNDTLINISGHFVENVPEPFYISDVEVSEILYSYFLSENAEWKKNNLDNLVKEGLVDNFYLSSILSNFSSVRPIKNISYYSACAFCRWLSEKTGKNVFLPTSSEWMQAAAVSNKNYELQKNSILNNSDEIIAMLGGVWEFTSSDYLPSSEVEDFLDEFDLNTEVVVKGGSFVNSVSDIDINSIGVFPKNMTSDYIGFRVAWR